MSSNYPPGVTGCEPEVGGYDPWEKLHEDLDKMMDDFTIDEAYTALRIGVDAIRTFRLYNKKNYRN